MGGTAAPVAALTFDDGPHPQSLQLSALLASYDMRATFFQCGMFVHQRGEISRELASRHEIGNHTETHPRLWLCRPSTIRDEVARAQDTILQAAGIAPRWFRSPYGQPGLGLRRALDGCALTGVRWSVIGRDWRLGARQIAARVLARVRPGAIICLHDGRDVNPCPDIGETIEAVRIIVPEMLERGYRFVTLSELRCPMN